MSLNCSEINLILQEANLQGAFIQKVLQPSYSTLVLTLYKKHSFNLFFSLEGSACRFNISQKKFSKSQKPLRFMELLRSRIVGMQIKSAEQINANRIVKFTLIDVRTSETLFLYVRFWSGATNIILTNNENKIIDAFYRRPAKKEITGGFFFEEPRLTTEQVNAELKKFPVREYDTSLLFNEYVDKSFESENPIINVENLQKEISFNYAKKISKLQKTKKTLEKKLSKLKDPDELKIFGDLILNNITSLQKSGPKDFLETIDYRNGKNVKIKLNKQKSPQENANDYYTRSKKIVTGKKTLTENIETLNKQIIDLEHLREKVKNETDIKKLKQILEKINLDPYKKIIKRKSEKNFSGLKFNIDGFLVFVGRNANENDELLRHCVRGRDLWLHVRDYAGSYVFVKSQNKKSVPLNVLLAAGNLAVFYSKAKKAGAASVYYTEVKNLRRAKDAKKGTVLPQREKTLFIKLDDDILAKNELSKIL